MYENENKQGFASPFDPPEPEQQPIVMQKIYETETAPPQEKPFDQPLGSTVEQLQERPTEPPQERPTEPPQELPAYARPSFAEKPYTQQPYSPSPYEQFAQAQQGQPEGELKRKKEKKRKEGPGGLGIGRKNTAILVIIIIVACVASGVGGGLIGAGLSDSGGTLTVGGNTILSIEPNDNITTTEAVAKKVLSSVVGITSTGRFLTDNGYFGQSESEVTGVGTGMIIDERGYILTNSHVVLDGTIDKLEVLLSSGEEVSGKVIWSDAGLDLAIVKVDATGLHPIELGDSDEVLIGSYAAAVGNPLGLEFSGSITQGVVSGLDRTITVAGSFGGRPSTMQGLIQVDAAINSGNSGGPLLNSRGQVIGINTAKAQAEGMGFAIPINTAIPIVEKVLRDGSFERVFMGVSAADVQVIKDNYPNVELVAESGACITDVNPGSPAEKGGLKVKDVIIAIDGREITGSDSLIKMLLNYMSGDTITVTFDRAGEILETQVTLLSQSELDKAQEEENPFISPERGNTGR